MTRDIVKKATKKIKSQIRSPVREDNQMKKTGKRTVSRGRKSSPKSESVVVTAGQDRNRLEIASSYTGYSSEHHDLQACQEF